MHRKVVRVHNVGELACLFVSFDRVLHEIKAENTNEESDNESNNVEEYPGHIACDGETKSEIVLPLLLPSSRSTSFTSSSPISSPEDSEVKALGVLDLDCLALGGFTEEDEDGLKSIAELIVRSCDWD